MQNAITFPPMQQDEERNDNRLALIVQDQELLCWTLTEVLSEIGYQTTCRRTVAEACEALGTKKYRMLITDYQLSDGSGCEVANYAHHMNPSTAIMMLSSDDELDPGNCAHRCPINVIIEKPFEIDDIAEHARKYLCNDFETEMKTIE